MLRVSRHLRTDCVIVGGGAAGLRAAIECLENGLKPILITKEVIGQAHTLMAEGGVNAAIGQRDPSDNWKVHFDDTMKAGRFINCRSMVEALCKEAPDRIYDVMSYGAGFKTDEKGKIIQTAGFAGGQTKERVVAVGDFIGFVFQRALLHKALQLGLEIMDETLCVQLIIDGDGQATGVLVYNLLKSELIIIWSPSIILACGGGGQLFSRTTNGAQTTGEGYVLGLEAGVELRDMEMVQFHPTALCGPSSAEGILVTEAARMIGGRLYNAKGERFMEHYDAERHELAPRDVITRAITQEIEEGRGTGNHGVFLDLTHIDKHIILNRLQNTTRIIRNYQGIDITKKPIEVAPAAHHFMGGLVPVNIETMETIPGVFICGEIAWGSHGANRLGGNALAETQVFGVRAGRSAVLRARKIKVKKFNMPDAKLAKRLEYLDNLFKSQHLKNSKSFYLIRNELKTIMFQHVGVSRSKESLEYALDRIASLETEFNSCQKILDNYYSFANIFECSKMITLAKLIIKSALFRKESRGAHFRSDFPIESSYRFNTSMLLTNQLKVSKVDVV